VDGRRRLRDRPRARRRLRQRRPTDFATALSIFQDAADTWREDGVPFWTLVGTASDGLDWLQDLE
jgi:hypothetical protein